MTRRSIVTVILLALAPVVALGLLDAGPNVPVVVALGLLAAAVFGLRSPLTASMAPPIPVVERPEPLTAPPDLRITSLRQALASGTGDQRLNQRLHEQLVAAADDELLASHGVDRHRDPVAAERVLGTELFDFVTDPANADGLTLRRLERIVTDIERLGPTTT